MPADDDDNSLPELDLHGYRAAEAQRRLAQELHACRVRGAPGLVVITGRGFGNLAQQPILRTKIEAWLATEEARRLGVRAFRRVHRDGALEVDLDFRDADAHRRASRVGLDGAGERAQQHAPRRESD